MTASYSTKYQQEIRTQLNHCLEHLPLADSRCQQGKVRDRYDLGDQLLLVTTDRQSAFDRQLALVPCKGQVLNQCSAWWFDRTQHIIDNHVIALPHPNVTLAKKCTVFAVEIIVRGYITGSTQTALWTQYQKGNRNYCGHLLPSDLKKNQKLNETIITPTTKSITGDEAISADEIITHGYMTAEEWQYISDKALALFDYGQTIARQRGLILVDTKYEFGKDEKGDILLVDEIHTPDSSRYWLADSYRHRFEQGLEPENIDKEFLRLWFSQHCDPYHDKTLPQAPPELIVELAARYIYLYEKITAQPFVYQTNLNETLAATLQHYLKSSPQ